MSKVEHGTYSRHVHKGKVIEIFHVIEASGDDPLKPGWYHDPINPQGPYDTEGDAFKHATK